MFQFWVCRVAYALSNVSVMIFVHAEVQCYRRITKRQYNTGVHKPQVTKFCAVASNVYGSSLCNLLYVSFVLPEIGGCC